MIKAIAFNLDGTLIDNEKARLSAWQRAAFKIKDINVKELWYKTLGLSEEDTRTVFCSLYGYKLYKKFMQLVNKFYKPHIVLNKGFQNFLPKILEDIKIAVVSNDTYAEAMNKLNMLNIKADVVVSKDICPLTRPNPDPYEILPRLLHIKQKHIAVFEGSENGVISALRAGYKKIFFFRDTIKLEHRLPNVIELEYKGIDNLYDEEVKPFGNYKET